ncbi:unnamed protein product [Trichobilharzia regenti]|nr:unnamed protein product [Trichobilharzia regenti]
MNLVINRTELYTPLDTLIDCMMVEQGYPNASQFLCEVSRSIGIFLAYVFPLVGIFDLAMNIIVAVVFLCLLHKNNRQFVLFGVLALSDIGIVISVGWIQLFPAFGLSYASSGTIYYFIMARSGISCKLTTCFQAICCILRGNVLLLVAIDRCVLIYKPMLYKKFSKFPVWIVLLTVVLISILMTLPIVLNTDLVKLFNLNACWLTHTHNSLIFYKGLLSETCFSQLVLVTIIDVLFLVKVIKWLRGRRQLAGTQLSEMKNISPTITTFLLHTTVFLFSLPCTVALLLKDTMDIQSRDVPTEFLRVLSLTRHIGWILIFFQSSMNIFLYTVRIRKFRQVLLKKFKCCVHKSIDNFQNSTRNTVLSTDTKGE